MASKGIALPVMVIEALTGSTGTRHTRRHEMGNLGLVIVSIIVSKLQAKTVSVEYILYCAGTSNLMQMK